MKARGPFCFGCERKIGMRKKWAITLLAALALCLLPVGAAANGAMGPDMTIIVLGGPEDLTIDIVKTDGINEGRIHLEGAVQIGFERRYRVDYLREWTAHPEEELLQNATKTTLEVRGTGLSWDIPADGIEYKGYSHLITLDVKNREVIPGQPPWRQPLLVGIRVVFTLLVEGVIFYWFGYRRKGSWAVFILTNVLTQTGLSFLMAQAEFGIYLLSLLVYFVAEPLVFIVEALAYAVLLREKSWKRGTACALSANAVSLFLGLLLYAFVPI